MGKSYSRDLRERVVNAVEGEGMSRRKAAARFGIGIKTAIDWVRSYRETGRLSARPRGGRRPGGSVGAPPDARTFKISSEISKNAGPADLVSAVLDLIT